MRENRRASHFPSNEFNFNSVGRTSNVAFLFFFNFSLLYSYSKRGAQESTAQIYTYLFGCIQHEMAVASYRLSLAYVYRSTVI